MCNYVKVLGTITSLSGLSPQNCNYTKPRSVKTRLDCISLIINTSKHFLNFGKFKLKINFLKKLN